MESSESSIWDKLPMQLKLDIFSMLDRESRLALQLSSRSNCEISSHCPHVLKSLDIRGAYDGTTDAQFSLKSAIVLPDSRSLVNEKRFVMERAAEEVVKIFKNKKSVVKELKLTSGCNMDHFLKALLKAIRAHKRDKNFNYKFAIRVEQIQWIGNIDKECRDFCDLLAYFDSSVLESIRIENYSMCRFAMIGLIRMEQFESAKKCFIQAMVGIPIECFLHFDSFDIKVPAVNGKALVEVVKKFRTEALPIDSFFSIASDEKIYDSIIDDVFDLMRIPMEERGSISTHTHNHVSKHSCHDQNTVFILKLDAGSVYGCIVSNDADQRTRMDLSVYMNLREMGVDFNDL